MAGYTESDERKKNKKLQSRLPYPAKISFRLGGEIESFTDKQKLREFSNTKPALQLLNFTTSFTAKGTSLDRKHERKGLQKQIQDNRVSGNRITHSNNYHKCKRIK